MAAVAKTVTDSLAREGAQASPIAIVGAGPAGIRLAREIVARKSCYPLVIYGEEPWEPYDRVQLSALLAGEIGWAGISNRLETSPANNVIQRHHCRVVAIDRVRRTVTDEYGNVQRFSYLVLATGSRPHIPEIPGIRLLGVFSFRDFGDVQRLLARSVRSRTTVVLGGGLLGLEAARGLKRRGTDVIVIDHAPHLMSQQLDSRAGELLLQRMLRLGVRVVTGTGLQVIRGTDAVSGVGLKDGRSFACDTIVVATGIRPNISLALEAGLSVGRGVRINASLQTSDSNIFAIGECAEYQGVVHGLVEPGFDQAAVLADILSGGRSRYQGSVSTTKLKVVGNHVFSIGVTEASNDLLGARSHVFEDPARGIYRKLVLSRHKIVGAIAIGEWSEIHRLRECVSRKRCLWPWQIRRFISEGLLWPGQGAIGVTDWPANATVCSCKGVSRGTLTVACNDGCCSVESLVAKTGASTVCGSCRPLLAELAGSSKIDPERAAPALVALALASLFLAGLFVIAPPVAFPDSVSVPVRWDALWRDGLIKQLTGFSLLGTAAFISAISLRKRFPGFSFGSYALWRVIHGLLGVVVVLVLVAHTGLRMGTNLNAMLMTGFVGLLIAGGLASGVIGLQHKLPAAAGRRIRTVSLWSHILLLWPLPVLLGFHVIKTYWF